MAYVGSAWTTNKSDPACCQKSYEGQVVGRPSPFDRIRIVFKRNEAPAGRQPQCFEREICAVDINGLAIDARSPEPIEIVEM